MEFLLCGNQEQLLGLLWHQFSLRPMRVRKLINAWGPTGSTIYSQTPPPIGTPFELVDDPSIASTNDDVSGANNLEKTWMTLVKKKRKELDSN